MLGRFYFRRFDTAYVFVDAAELGSAQRPGDVGLERVLSCEARRVVEGLAREEPELFARVSRLADGGEASLGRGPTRGARLASEAGVERVLGALGVDHDGGFARLALLRPVREMRSLRTQGSMEGVRIDRLLEQLRHEPIVLRGHQYQLAHGSTNSGVKVREMFEAQSEAQLLAVLAELSADAATLEARRKLFAELLSLAETQRARSGRTDLLLLRRERVIARVREQSGPAITPSQLQRQRERHWIAIEAVDEQEGPVSDLRLELVLPDGSLASITTDELGVARFEPVPAGEVAIRVLDLERARWRPVGGAPAQPSRTGRAARLHVVRQGENLTMIADRHGFKGWKTLWQHAANEALRKRRKSPHVLLPGDTVAIPPLDGAELVRSVDAVHRIEVSRCSLRARFRLQDLAGAPLADLAYDCSYRVGEKAWQSAHGATDGEGWLDQRLPLGVATLTVETRTPRLRFVYELGHLHPARDLDDDKPIPSGVQRRLAGLGYRRTERAVAAFQRLEIADQERKGALDAETLAALERSYTA